MIKIDGLNKKQQAIFKDIKDSIFGRGRYTLTIISHEPNAESEQFKVKNVAKRLKTLNNSWQLLKNEGIDPSKAKDVNNSNLLCQAIESLKNFEQPFIDFLIENGVSISDKDVYYKNSLDYCLKSCGSFKEEDEREVLKTNAAVKIIEKLDENNKTNKIQLQKLVNNFFDPDKKLIISSEYNRAKLKVFNALLDKELNFDMVEPNMGLTFLHKMASSVSKAGDDALHIKIMQKLSRKTANINKKDYLGATPLIAAVRRLPAKSLDKRFVKVHLAIALMLIKEGASPYIKDNFNNSCIDYLKRKSLYINKIKEAVIEYDNNHDECIQN